MAGSKWAEEGIPTKGIQEYRIMVQAESPPMCQSLAADTEENDWIKPLSKENEQQVSTGCGQELEILKQM